MAESRCHGNSSCVQRRDAASAAALLTRLATSEPISSLHTSLGNVAQLHLVGGTVRDCFLGATTVDIDLATALSASDCAHRLRDSGYRVIETGLQHGTITVVVNDQNIEITSFRGGRVHDKAPNIEDDLRLRDFTINAIAFSVDSRLIVDPVGGIEDLDRGTLRCPGSAAECFADDPLRMLRAIRFGPAAGRCLEAAITAHITQEAASLANMSVERIREELKKILLQPQAAAGMRSLKDLGLLPYVLPELVPSVGFEQNDFHIHDVFEHTLWVLERCPLELRLRLVALFHDIGKPHTLSVDEKGRRHFYNHEDVGAQITEEAMQRLKFSNAEIESVKRLVRYHMRPIDCGPSAVRRLMRDLGEDFETWKGIKLADAPPKVEQSLVDEAFNRFLEMCAAEKERCKAAPYGTLAIDGNDLIALGMRPGPKLGKILKQLEEQVIEQPSLNEHSILLARAQELIKTGG